VDPLLQGAFPFSLCKRANQIRKRDERDALSGARGPKQMNDLASRDEVQFGKRQDAGLVERRLEREVVAGECLDGVQPAHPQSGADASFLAERKFFEEKLLDHFERGNFAAVETGYAGIDHFDGARHFEANHADFDAIKQRCRRIGKQRVHAPAPAVAIW